MTREEFRKLTEKVVLLDGAMGSVLMKKGMPRGVCTEAWLLDHPQLLKEIQEDYILAGSQIIYAPTFGCNRYSLRRYRLQDQLADMNTRLVTLSKEIADGRALVAGDITTSGQIPGVTNDYTYEDALEMYKEQMSVIAAAGADLFIVETMISIDETMAAVEAAHHVSDLPVMCTMTVEADGTIFSGGNATDAVAMLQELGADAVGVNCSVGPDQLEAIVRNMKAVATVPVIAKPNAGMPTITDKGEAVYSMDPASFAVNMKNLVEAGAGIIGGCCGTSPEYIRAVHEVL